MRGRVTLFQFQWSLIHNTAVFNSYLEEKIALFLGYFKAIIVIKYIYRNKIGTQINEV